MHLLPWNTARQFFGAGLMLAVFAYALWKGGRPERLAAWAMLTAYVATIFAAGLTGMFEPRWGVMAVDLALLAVITFVAVRSDRYWPMWAAGFLAVEAVMHLTIILDRKVLPTAYVVATHLWSYPVLLSLVLGTWSAARRRERLRRGQADEPEGRRP